MQNKRISKKEFTEKVFPAELEEIKQRRETIEASTDDLEGGISVNRGLVGLAISGGGIRSATFSLGVIQGLAQQRWLKMVDYLSTVSGGGYIGSCLSSLLNDPKTKSTRADFPLKYTEGDAEPDALTHLRNSSNYLSPGGLLDKLRLPNILLRGILLNLFIFMPYIMAAVFLTEVAYEKGPNWDDLAALVLPISLIFVVMSIIFPFATRFLRRHFDWSRRNRFELWLTVPLLLVFAITFIIPLLHLTRIAIEHNADQILSWITTIGPGTIWKSGAVFIVIVGLFMFAGKASQNAALWRGKLLITLLGFLGPTVIFAIYFALCLWQIDSPFIPTSSIQPLNDATQCEEPCLAKLGQSEASDPQSITSFEQFVKSLFEEEGEVNNFNELLRALNGRSLSVSENAIVTCESNNCETDVPIENWRDDQRVWVINDAPHLQPECPKFAEIDPFENIGIVGNCHYIVRDSADQLRIEGNQLRLFSRSEDFAFLLVFVSLLLFNRFFLDMNITSMHGFYRDRLSKAFLIRRDDEGNVIHKDKQKLSEMSQPGTMAPYHILNVALNLQGSKDADLRGRKADFFIFSKRYIGSDRTGFSKTKDVEEFDSHLDLGTAMAVSGAAAAPNMGTTSNRSLSFILTLLNIRLGYWLPNPIEVNKESGLFKWLTLGGAKPTLIWREALGKLDASSSHVNLSDGGHIENMALYPLLKRRCKQIILIDGEADPDMSFGGLVTVMRYARIDMGIKIDIDLEAIRKNEAGYSNASWAIGDIYYGDGELGHLIYVKLSVVGNEPEYVRAYRSRHPEFPHQSTSDQFFSEDQFEAYRALGEHICKSFMRHKEALTGFSHLGQ